MKIPYKKIFPYIILIGLMIVAFVFRGFVSYSDASSSWFEPFYNLKQLFWVWDTYDAFGRYLPNNFTSFWLRLFYSFGELFNQHPSFIQQFSWILFFSITGIIIFNIVNHYLKNYFFSIITILFLFFNPISQLFLWNQQHWSYYLIFPYFISIYWYFKYVETKKRVFLIYISLIWFIFGFAFNQPAYFVPLLLILAIMMAYYIFKSKNVKVFLLDHLVFLLTFFAINFIYFLPLILGGNQILQSTRSFYAHGTAMPILQDLKNVNFYYSFINITKGYDQYFSENFIFLICWTLLFVFFLYYSFIKENPNEKVKNIFTLFSILLLIFIFFIKGISKPFSAISEYIYGFKLMYIFRAFKDKFAIGFSVILSCLYILTLKYSSKYIRVFLIGMAIFSYISFVSNYWLPYDYKAADNLEYIRDINLDKTISSRVLNLPLVDYSFFYTDNPNYQGDNPLKNLLKKDVVYSDIYFTDKDTLELKQKLNNKISEKEFYDYLKANNIEYILNNKNSYVKEDANPFAYDYKILHRFTKIKKIKDNEHYELYRFNDLDPLISSENIKFEKINPIMYKIYMYQLENTRNITFNMNYNSGWKLYIQKSPNDKWCNINKQYLKITTAECHEKIKYIIGDSIKYLWQQPIYHIPNKAIVKKRNTWTINANDIKKDLSRDYYTVNENNSINTEFILYFQPQSYFLLGLYVSLISIITTLFFIFWKKLKNEKK